MRFDVVLPLSLLQVFRSAVDLYTDSPLQVWSLDPSRPAKRPVGCCTFMMSPSDSLDDTHVGASVSAMLVC